VIGIQGLAPYWFEVETSLNISNKGDLTMNFEVEYEILLTQELILQPHAELVFSFQDVPEIDLGSGFSHFETGLRLRYEIKREFAPYIGVSWHKAFGNTANYARIGGHNPSSVSALIGIRAWY
jgi:copper resistance protein B